MKPWFAVIPGVCVDRGMCRRSKRCAGSRNGATARGPAEAGGRQWRRQRPRRRYATAADAPKFTTEAKWILAGYNNNEIVYTIIVTSQDSRIIRCTTDMQGFYFDNGAKETISDRQVTTILPNQPTQVGNWMDMDEKSGATYQVQCKPV
jgi:hypothetical protein